MSLQNNLVLGIDTSNYKTSAAVYCPETGAWRSCGRLLDVPAGALGLRQNDALFQHTRRLPALIAEACGQLPGRISAVGYSHRPRDLEDSYMPCFLAGVSVAESLAAATGIPAWSFSHQQGHLAAAAFSVGKPELLEQEFFAWHLSGGTTELLLVRPEGERRLQAHIVGGTSDISAGQLIDRTGVALGMPFPAGPFVEQAALQSQSREAFAVKVNDGVFSLSGVENQVHGRIEAGMPQADVCAFTLNTVCRAVSAASEQVRKKQRLPMLVSGGVSACGVLRDALRRDPDTWVAEQGLGGDNALGVALLAARKR